MRRLLIVEPDRDLRRDLLRIASAAGHRADAVGTAASAAARSASEHFDAILIDLSGPEPLGPLARLRAATPGTPLVAMSAHASSRLAIEACHHGATVLLPKPFSLPRLETALAVALERRSGDALPDPTFVTWDPATTRVLRLAEACAATEATLLFEGESGTGKSLLARHVHARSTRRWRPLLVLDPSDPESAQEVGAEAEAGTLLVPGIDEASERFQKRLLERMQPALAAPRPRVIATTRRALSGEGATHPLRPELALRLSVLPLRIPPLRERAADLTRLTRHLVARHAAARGVPPPRVTPDAVEWLRGRSFRGNVRELENLVRRAVLLRPGAEIDAAALQGAPPAAVDADRDTGADLNLRELERHAIERCLARYGNNRTHASRALGISVRTLRNKIRRYGLA